MLWKEEALRLACADAGMDERRGDEDMTGFQGSTATVQYATAVNSRVVFMS
jgi:hypothetical protein